MENNIIAQHTQALKQLVATLPLKMGDEALIFTNKRFASQNWVDNTTTPWRQRKVGSKRNKGRGILMNTGRLRRGNRIIRTTNNSVTIGNDVPYAKAHNDGFRGTVQIKSHERSKFNKDRIENGLTKKGNKAYKTVTSITGSSQVKAHSRRLNIPKRQFMGDSKVLDKQIERMITIQLNKIFK